MAREAFSRLSTAAGVFLLSLFLFVVLGFIINAIVYEYPLYGGKVLFFGGFVAFGTLGGAVILLLGSIRICKDPAFFKTFSAMK